MMRIYTKLGVWVCVGLSALFLVWPACLLLILLVLGCLWVLGFLCVVRFLLRLWNPRIQAVVQKRKLKKKEKGQDFDGSRLQFEGGSELEERLLRVQQYLEDQLNNVGDRVLQLYHHVTEDQDLLVRGSDSPCGAQLESCTQAPSSL